MSRRFILMAAYYFDGRVSKTKVHDNSLYAACICIHLPIFGVIMAICADAYQFIVETIKTVYGKWMLLLGERN